MDLNNITQDDFEYIEAYLNHTLSKEEVVAFEKRLKKDKTFAAAVEDIRLAIAGIETQALKEQLNTFHAEIDTDKKAITNSDRKVIYMHWKKIAVVAILLIVAGSWLFFNLNSNARLYSKYYKPDPGLPTAMSSNTNYEFYNAMVSYKRGEYDKALKIWKDQLRTKAENDTLNYFVGSALMADEQETQAIPFLQEVTTQNQSVFTNDAWYYLGLAYLKTNEEAKAIEALEQSDLPKAKTLLENLK
jgi:predicted Zn-dependent protease